MRSRFALIFAASGAAALIYEVAWTRMLTLQVGHGIAAASTVLAAFMGGLAIGSAIGGRVAARIPPARALRAYAALEVAVAVLAVILPLELRLFEPVLAMAYAEGQGGAAFGLIRITFSLLVLSVPAAAMGATFPVAARWFVNDAARAARDAGTLYAANTVGAALGAVLAGFILLPALGLSGTTWIGVVLNLVAAVGAWLLSGRAVPADDPESSQAPKLPVEPHEPAVKVRRKAPRRGRPAVPARMARPALAAVALAVSGFSSLVLQVVWTRLLAMVFGPTTYAFSTMVAIFIAGLAIGAALAARLVPSLRHPTTALAVSMLVAVGAGAGAAWFVDTALLSVATVMTQPGVSFSDVLGRQALIAISLLAPMTIAFGAAFPFAVAVATRRQDTVATDLGFIYAANTAGAVTGALAAGFLLIPALGLHTTIRALTVAGAFGALVILLAGRPSRTPWLAGGLVLAVAAGGFLLPQWDRSLLSAGGYKYASVMRAPDLRTGLTAGDLLYYREGASATVAVRRSAGTTSLAIDGKVDASNAGDMLTQRLLAHVPLLLHPDPKQVAILGLGSGVTLGSALTHPIDRADVLEISPEVVEASRFFDLENHQALDDERTRLLIGDGRTHLLYARSRYDVIISEPSNPWMAGIASLFTREFFQAARERLTPGGILCQWAHTYDMSTADLQSIVATFLSVFPDGTLWLIGDGDVLLVGSTAPLEPRLSAVGDAWRRPRVADDLASVGAREPYHVLSLFVAQGPALARWSAGAPIQADNRAALEFSGPFNAFGLPTADNAALLRALASESDAVPPALTAMHDAASASARRDRGLMLLSAEAARPAYEELVTVVEATPDDRLALDGLIRASAANQKNAETQALLKRLAAAPARVEAKLALSRMLAAEGVFDEAIQITVAILQAQPSHVPAIEQLASILSDLGDVERMKPVVMRLQAEAPGSEAAHYYSSALLFLEGRLELALAEAQRTVSINPRHAKAHNLIGASLASLGRRDRAREAFLASIAIDPRDPGTYTNLATLEQQAGNLDLAAKYFVEALMIDPALESARQALASLGRE